MSELIQKYLNKRFVTKIESMHLIERVRYEKWCDLLTVDSYFVPDEVMAQLKYFYPESLIQE